jgi:hypothetical protein
VEAQLRLVNPAVLQSPVRHLAMLEEQLDGLRVRLFNEGGQLLEERLLPGPASCAEWARIAAALLATWETELAAPELPALMLPVPPAPSPPPAKPTPPPSKPAEGRKTRWQGEIGLGVSGSLASDGSFALGGEVLAGVAPAGRPYGGQLALIGTGARSLSVGGGTALWQRFALGLGGYGRLGSETWRLYLGGELYAGLLNLRGQSFLMPETGVTFDPGLGLSGRLGWKFARHWMTWLELGASYWLPRNVDVVVNAEVRYSEPIPPLDISLTLGFSLVGDL